MKNAIITMSDAKYGCFLINHWLASLHHNVNLKNTDIIVLDYGLTDIQVEMLVKKGVIVRKCIRDGHVNIIRFRDIPRTISKKSYGQIMMCDGGDIIFQSDVSTLFDKDRGKFRAVCEGINPPFEVYLNSKFFSNEDVKKISKTIKGRKMINAGVMIASKGNIARLCKKTYAMVRDKSSFGPDQLVVNYILFNEGFKELDSGYNYVVTTARRPFYVKNGVFYFTNGKIIPIVHNAGNYLIFRTVRDFGYGKDCNQLKTFSYFALRALYSAIRFFRIN